MDNTAVTIHVQVFECLFLILLGEWNCWATWYLVYKLPDCFPNCLCTILHSPVMYECSPGSTSSSTFDVVGLNFSHSDGGGGGIILKLKILNTLWQMILYGLLNDIVSSFLNSVLMATAEVSFSEFHSDLY